MNALAASFREKMTCMMMMCIERSIFGERSVSLPPSAMTYMGARRKDYYGTGTLVASLLLSVVLPWGQEEEEAPKRTFCEKKEFGVGTKNGRVSVSSSPLLSLTLSN